MDPPTLPDELSFLMERIFVLLQVTEDGEDAAVIVVYTTSVCTLLL